MAFAPDRHRLSCTCGSKEVFISPRSFALTGLLLTVSSAALAAAMHSLAGEVARGQYLVENVAGCGDCHTPRDAHGIPVHQRTLAGAPIGFAPLNPLPQWAAWAPALAGLTTGFDERQLS